MTSRDRAFEAVKRLKSVYKLAGYEWQKEIERAIDEAVEAEREEIHAAVKRAFVAPEPDEHGRPYSDVPPLVQVRIKGAIRARKEKANASER